jgi:hypothetical protein
MSDTCECCGKTLRSVVPVLIDQNYETELCGKCIIALRAECDVEVM